jgi:hypothetical protein
MAANAPDARASTTTHVRAIGAAQTAAFRNLVIFRKPYDLSQVADVDELDAELDRASDGAVSRGELVPVLPASGVHILVYARPQDGGEPFAVFVPERFAELVLFGMGCMDSRETAVSLCPDPTLMPLTDVRRPR